MPPRFVPDLKFNARDGGYARGQEGYELILRAALDLMIEHGYKALSFRRIAEASGMKVGHISYYFPTKEELARVLFDAVISSYQTEFDKLVHEPGITPEQRLEDLIVLILADITTKKTTHFFMELWALSNHDPFVFDRVHELYCRARLPLNNIIAEINPALSETEREMLTLFISASMEGMTVFAGHEKPFRNRMPILERIAIQSFVRLVRDIKPGDMLDVADKAALAGRTVDNHQTSQQTL